MSQNKTINPKSTNQGAEGTLYRKSSDGQFIKESRTKGVKPGKPPSLRKTK